MKSLQHVLWRGALALSLMAIGVGSGLGMPPAEQATPPADCAPAPRALIADQTSGEQADTQGHTVVVLRRPLTPAG